MSPRLWRLGPDQAAIWRDIRLDALLDAPHAFDDVLAEQVDQPLAEFAQWLAACECWAAAAPSQDAPQAVAVLSYDISPAEPDLGWIGAVYARPEARGQGLIQALLAHLAVRAQAHGMTRLGLHVGRDNAAALAAYRRAGFVATGGPEMRNAQGVVEIEMRRMLGAADRRA